MRMPPPLPFHGPGDGGGATTSFIRRDRYAAGDEIVQVTLLDAHAFEIRYQTARMITTFRHPISLAAIHPGPSDQSLVALLGISAGMLAEIRSELMTRSISADQTLRAFQNAQRMVFEDGFMGDTMDDDDVVRRPV